MKIQRIAAEVDGNYIYVGLEDADSLIGLVREEIVENVIDLQIPVIYNGDPDIDPYERYAKEICNSLEAVGSYFDDNIEAHFYKRGSVFYTDQIRISYDPDKDDVFMRRSALYIVMPKTV